MSNQSVSVHAVRRPLIHFLRLHSRTWAAILLPVLLTACAQEKLRVPSGHNAPSRATVSGVPLIQQNEFYCGPASLAMVFQWSGLDVTQSEVATQSFTPGAEGTYLADMIGAARRQELLAVRLSTLEELLDEVAVGHPVIIFQNLGFKWAPRWHYAVVVGYDLDLQEIFLHSGQHERMTMDLQLFMRTWKRGEFWALTVLPPNRLPTTDNQWAILRAAAGLEQLGHTQAASKVYINGGTRWPDNWIWAYGLGNTRYQQGDLEAAKRAFERAKKIDPSPQEIHHNLRQVNAEIANARKVDNATQ
nr:PA2778 family cysteine peptidase [Ruegeria atlantica]